MAVACGSDFTVLLTERKGLIFYGSGAIDLLEGLAGESASAPLMLGGWECGEPVGGAVNELPGGMQAAAALAQIEGALGSPRRIFDPAHCGFFEDVVMVAGVSGCCMCVTESGAVIATGDNSSGSLGLGDFDRRRSFATLGLEAFGRHPAMMVACGLFHTLVLTRTGLVWAFGNGRKGQNANQGLVYVSTPTRVAGLDNIAMVAAGWYTSVALGADGRVWTWGSSCQGVLGHGDAENRAMPIPRALDQLSFDGDAVLFVAAGYMYMMAVTTRGDLWAWGRGNPDNWASATTRICGCPHGSRTRGTARAYAW